MSDFYDEIMNNEMPKSEQNKPEPEEPIEASAAAQEPVQQPEPNEEPIQQTDSYEEPVQHTESYEEPAQETEPSESSYEWNAEDKTESGEYHYSYVNGNNSSASHNPNNYDSYRSQPTGSQGYGYQQPRQTTANPYGYQSQQSAYNSYSSAPNYGTQQQQPQQPKHQAAKAPKPPKQKKEKKPVSRGFIAAMLAITMVGSAALGFGGGMLAKNMNTTTAGNVTINQVSPGSSVTQTSSVTANTTSDIVKKTADSVVEIATEGTVTGSFARQYITKGAGSGVIISQDGYIVTNHHVIEGANTITVTLRDGKTNYKATLIGSDEDNDIALLKIDAQGLSPATFGDSSSLAVGDYVVAIGNPLGTLGGTVTDGIISALAREVTIEDKNMTLLQTNAQISPGNSGGGLFNANGELVGIVNAKDSATEVEGIAFAIPVSNVLDIIKDLQNYGYVTGKIDLGMEFVDINSNDTAFYYGVNQLGCYVLSVNVGSNAEKAGFKRGDLIVAVNETKVSTSEEISKALENCKVGDSVNITVSRDGQTSDIKLTLQEYVPSAKLNNDAQSDNSDGNGNSRGRSFDEFFDEIFGW